MYKLVDGWNFHNYVAIPLESKAHRVLGAGRDWEKRNKYYSADSIEGGNFISVLDMVLRVATNYDNNEDIDKFLIKNNNSRNIGATSMGKEKAIEIYNEYKELLKKITGEVN